MNTPFPQSSLDQAARDAAANKPQNILDHWKKKIMQMPGFQKPAPAPTSSQAQTARDAKAGAEAIRKLNAAKTGGSLVGGSVTGAVTAPLILGGSEDASIKWRRLGYPSKEAYDTAVAKNSYRDKPISADNPLRKDKPIPPRVGSRGPMFMDPVGPSRSMPGASSFMDPVAPKDADVTQLATKPGRQILPAEETRDIPTGGKQTGKNLGGGVDVAFVPEYANSSFNQLLAGVNTSGYQPFSSNQLPTTQGNPFEGEAPKTDGFNPAAPGITGATYDNYGADGGVAAASSTDKSEFTPMTGKEERIEGGSDRKKGGSLADALADTAGINSYMSKFSSGDRERAANRAFLDTEDSMLALRAKEAVNGVVYAGGNHYVAGESADSPAVRIDRSDARDISNNKAKAEQFKSKKVEDTIAATKQEPPTLEKPDIKQSFERTETVSAPINTSIPGNVEFNSNNDNPLPAFGAPTGFKPQSKKPAVDYSTIFKY